MTVVIEDLYNAPATPAPVPSIRIRRALGAVAVAGALFATGVLAVAVFTGADDPAATDPPNQVLLDRGSVVAVERSAADNPHSGLNEVGGIRAVEHAVDPAAG
jgi:hypothetical protein